MHMYINSFKAFVSVLFLIQNSFSINSSSKIPCEVQKHEKNQGGEIRFTVKIPLANCSRQLV